MYAALTVRKLKPGAYDDWRKAWDPGEGNWPEGVKKAYILRKLDDENEVIAFGFFEGDLDTLRNDVSFREEARRRVEAMAPFIDSIGADGLYEVIEEVSPS
jgi:hypothetical protein